VSSGSGSTPRTTNSPVSIQVVSHGQIGEVAVDVEWWRKAAQTQGKPKPTTNKPNTEIGPGRAYLRREDSGSATRVRSDGVSLARLRQKGFSVSAAVRVEFGVRERTTGQLESGPSVTDYNKSWSAHNTQYTVHAR
jgi:hypothetical protein